MEMISLFAVTYLVIVPALVYWCVDKRSGLYSLASYGLGVAINAVVKLTACVYRPWNTGQQDSSCRRCDYYSDRIFVS
ncbi:MAG: hypothetical protein IJI78_00850 [Oscillospiraceae bacterium]|nr:hypothetical protein [Oscillospiraceae bacterium]